MILVRIHESYKKVIAICDADLLGKKFVEGNLQLDIKDTFYGGKQMSKDKVVKMIREEAVEDPTFNIVGKESVEAAIEAGIIDDSEDSIIRVQGIPHALSLI